MIYYYGGKFNPFTLGHFKVLRNLCNLTDTWDSNKDQIVVGVTKLLDESGIESNALISNEEMRIEMVESIFPMLEKEIPGLNGHLVTVIQNESSTYEFLKKTYPDDKICLVLGVDEAEDLRESLDSSQPKWRYAEEILKEYGIIEIDRDGVISSTAIREIFHNNPYVEYNDVKKFIQLPIFNYIKKHDLYWQHGFEDDARREENKFLKEYDFSKFPKPSATADMIVISKDKASILLIRRKGHPYRGYWALPGGFFDIIEDESLEETASRELEEETGIIYHFSPEDQFRVYSLKGVDPRGRIIDTVFKFALNDDDMVNPKAGDDAGEICWFKLDELPKMAFNHRKIINDFIKTYGKE